LQLSRHKANFIKTGGMNTTQIRTRIIERINAIEDPSFLKALDLLTKEKSNKAVYQLSEIQKSRIETARQQLASGKTIPHEQVQSLVEKWLDSK
jgi:hypothetical protein